MNSEGHMKTTGTKHKADCQMAFGRKDATCPRCQELLAGSPARSSWHKSHFEMKARQDAVRALPHSCAAHNCGAVCTFGDW
jgi:hypothetical protein